MVHARAGRGKVAWVALLAAMAMGVSAVAASSGQPADAAPRFKIVTKTFSNANVVVIPLAGDPAKATPYPSVIKVGGFNRGAIRDVNVKLKGFSHTNPDDVDVMLGYGSSSEPDAVVLSDAGGTWDAKALTLTLDDEAPTSVPDSGVLSGGAYRPANYAPIADGFPDALSGTSGGERLSRFDGVGPNRLWRLYVVDDTPGVGAGGFGGGWELKITARVRR